MPKGWIPPSLVDTRRLRDAIRSLLDAAVSELPVEPAALEVVNSVSATVTTTLEATTSSDSVRSVERWKAKRPADLALGAAARSAIELLADPGDLERLRRCANRTCSMLFVNGDGLRVWCTPNICGNRTRVARHYHRHRQPDHL